MKLEKGFWYFAHPYTAKDKDGNYVSEAENANYFLANQRAAELLKRGYNIYSPISHTHPIHIACVEFLRNHEHEIWYELDNDLIERTNFTGIILAPNWETSKGCKDELELFKKKGLDVLLFTEVMKEDAIYT
ncbi:MAG: DUF1937 family protein [Nanoarchaeota archaeon]|nr:DUF1937 family protein [Nanoarchaeota archaeon]